MFDKIALLENFNRFLIKKLYLYANNNPDKKIEQ